MYDHAALVAVADHGVLWIDAGQVVLEHIIGHAVHCKDDEA